MQQDICDKRKVNASSRQFSQQRKERIVCGSIRTSNNNNVIRETASLKGKFKGILVTKEIL